MPRKAPPPHDLPELRPDHELEDNPTMHPDHELPGRKVRASLPAGGGNPLIRALIFGSLLTLIVGLVLALVGVHFDVILPGLALFWMGAIAIFYVFRRHP